MIGREQVEKVVQRALALSDAEQTHVSLHAGRSSLTRVAQNAIHQNVAEHNCVMTVRAVFGRRIGTASTTDVSDDGVRQAVERACGIAKLSREDKKFVSLLRPPADAYPQVAAYSERTAAFDELQRAAAAAVLRDTAAAADLQSAGVIQVQVSERAVANTLGVWAYAPQTQAEANTVFMSDDSAGYAADHATDVGLIDFARLAGIASAKCGKSRGAEAVDAGEYTVILEPEAVGALLLFLVRVGFHHLLYRQGGSFLSRKLGRQVLGRNITIWDDGTDPRGIPVPFDSEGAPKRKLVLFENGVFRNMVYDSYTAAQDGRASTGHAVPFVGFGAVPTNVFMQPGEASMDDLISSVRRGLLITRFHYTNLVNLRGVVLTGLTRDGTFLIEDGRVVRPVKNMRFTHSALQAMREVEMVGRDTARLGMATLPALKIGRFTFTGQTGY